MLHELLRTISGIQNSQLGEDTHVRPLQSQTTFHEGNQLIKASPVLIIFANLFQVIHLYDYIETTYLGQSKFLSINTSKADFLPCFCTVSLAGRINSTLELFQLNKCNS
uniref:Uncharacterized protein n=1 Tax=Opuntia streptacantha TaxID=393608 RepID=A0A7C9CZ54_OPUST